jgi:signal peptidase II
MKIKYLMLVSITGFIVCIDQLTKTLVHTQFRLGDPHVIIPNFFNLTYVRNPGAAFGFLAESPEFFRETFFLAFPPIAMATIFFVLRGIKDNDRVQTVALSLVFGGALGNYIDRVRFRFVIDFLDFHIANKYVWPAFNIADSAIVIGIGILLVLSFTRKEEEA